MSRRRTKVDKDRRRETDTQMDCHLTKIVLVLSTPPWLAAAIYSTKYIQAKARTELRTKNLKLWNASYNMGKKPPSPPPPPSCCASKNQQQEESMCVCELPPLASSYRQLQVCRFGLRYASHSACVQHLFSDRGWYSMNREKQLLVTNEPVEVQDFRKATDFHKHASKSKDGTYNETFKAVECKL